MAFDGTEGQQIDLTTAAKYTADYRAANPGATKGHFFGKEIIEQILAQEDCQGIRIYYGVNDKEECQELVICGADDNEDDILGIVADVSVPCPDRCGKANTLNS